MTLIEAIAERERLLKLITMVEQECREEWCGTLIEFRLKELRQKLNTLNSEILIAQQTAAMPSKESSS
jgi:hypothetical protein